MPNIPYWLDPTISQTKSLALSQANARRVARRQNGEIDAVENSEAQFLNPIDLELLKRDIDAYNLSLAGQPNKDATGAYVIAGALILFGIVLLKT